MGREIETEVCFRGQSGRCKLLLESHEIILRGTIRARLARPAPGATRAEGETLVIDTEDGPLLARLGPAAGRWADALSRPPPSLAAKLGLGPDRRVLVIGPVEDSVLAAALAGFTAQATEAAMTLADLSGPDAFARAWAAAEPLGLPFWGVTRKGRGSPFPENRLREFLRAAGWIDSKTCAVSDLSTATRFAPRHPTPSLSA